MTTYFRVETPLSVKTDYETEILALVSRYYDVADGVTDAVAAGCRKLKVNPFAAINRQEADLRSRALGP